MSRSITEFLNSKKVELSSSKIELAGVKDVIRVRDGVLKDITNLDKEQSSLNDLESKLFNAQKEYVKNVRLTETGISLLENTAKDFQKQADDLGLGNQPIVTGTIKEAKSLTAKIKNHTDKASRIK